MDPVPITSDTCKSETNSINLRDLHCCCSFFQPGLESKCMDRPSLCKQQHWLKVLLHPQWSSAGRRDCLEKSHVISQEAAKRYYDIFHQILSKKKLELIGMALCKLLLVPNPNHYHWVHRGVITADNTDDGQEPLLTNVAFDVLGSSPEERICDSKLTRGIMHLGSMKFKQKPREEQAEVENTDINMLIFPPVVADKITQLMGLKSGELQRGHRQAQGESGEQAGAERRPLSTIVPELGIWPARACSPRPLMATEGCHYNNRLGKSPNFLKPKGGKGKGAEADFEHRGWLQKNEDPLNEAVVGLLQKSSMPPLWVLFKEEEAAAGGGKRQERGSSFVTASDFYRGLVQPANKSQSLLSVHGAIPLGLLAEGRTFTANSACDGNPRRNSYITLINHGNSELQRGRATYQSLNPSIIPPGFVDNKAASELLPGSTDPGEKDLFFCAGILATLEDVRDEPLAKIMTMPQCHAHGFLIRTEYKKMLLGLTAIQRNVQKFLQLLFWGGWKLYGRVKPLLNVAQAEENVLKKLELRSIVSKTQEFTEHAKAEERTATLSQEKNDLPIQLQAEQENLLDAEECLAQMMKSKMDLLSQILAMKADMRASKRMLQHLSDLKCDLEELETTLARTEKEKQALDYRVRTLTSELSAQNDSVTKFQKEKRALEEVHQAEITAPFFFILSHSLSPSLGKGGGGNVCLLKYCETTVCCTNRKGAVFFHLGIPVPCLIMPHTCYHCFQNGYASKYTQALWHEIRISSLFPTRWRNKEDCLEEAGVATTAQIQNCKREAGLLKLLLELEKAALQSKATGSTLRRKHTVAMAETAELMENPRVKAKLETDKQVTKAEIDDLSASTDSLQKSKLNSDAHVHKLEDNMSEANAQLAEVEKSQAEINAIRLQAENSQLSREHEEAQSRHNRIVHIKISLTSQADDFKRQLDEESKSCTTAVASLANTKHDLEPMKTLVEEEESKAELQCLVSKLNTEVIIWRTKYMTDGIERTKELEGTKTKLAVRLQEAAETAESIQAWVANTEKTNRLQKEVEDLTVDLEKANAACAALHKKQRAFDKMLAEWQQKCKELQVEVDSSQKEYTTENFELKTAYEESLEHLESMKKENKALQEEIKDLINQLGEGGKSIHELQKIELETEKDELRVALEEAHPSLRAEKSKLICIQLKLAQVKADIDRRHEKEELETTRYSDDMTLSHRRKLRHGDFKLDTRKVLQSLRGITPLTRLSGGCRVSIIGSWIRLNITECCTICFTRLCKNNHQRAIESLQASLETEAEGSAEALRLKKMDTDLTRIEMQLDHANRNNSELVRTLTKMQQHVKDPRIQTDEDARQHEEELQEQYKRLSPLQAELEVQTGLEGSEHSHKLLEQAEVMEKT
ncbi:LOW QUALITY PROTEIN: uncharacterized protein MYH16 [Spheniscus humboldti]